MHTFLDTHFAIATVLYPLVNIVVLILLLIGTIRTTIKKPLAILAVATLLFLLPQGANLLYFLKKTLVLGFPPPGVVRIMFPVQAVAEYLAFPLHVAGIFLLIKALMKQCPDSRPFSEHSRFAKNPK